MVRSNIKFTYEDYKSLPEGDPKRYELLEGELVVVPSPGERHQSLVLELAIILSKLVKESGSGKVLIAPLDVVLGENVVQPDIIFISNERFSIRTGGEIRGAPDLVIEILSPGTAARDRGIKKRIYARHGVREFWTVDPDKETIEVAKLGKAGFETSAIYQKGDTLVSSVLPGLDIKVNEVF